MQYGGNQQQRFLNMMMQARQQQAAVRRQAGPGALYPGFAPHGLPLQHQQHHAQIPQPTFVTCVTENDVLLGRGTPCAENEGNVRFRRLVKERKMEYIAAEKRMRKDAIAREILETIVARGGKFLRKLILQPWNHLLPILWHRHPISHPVLHISFRVNTIGPSCWPFYSLFSTRHRVSMR